MRTFKIVLSILTLIPLGTGLLDLVLGVRALQLLDPLLSTQALSNPSLDSQFRFAGAIWVGYAVLIVLIMSDFWRYATLLRILLVIIFVSGIGRAASMFQLGMPTPIFVGATLLELIGMPLLLWWHWLLEQSQVRSVSHDESNLRFTDHAA